MKLETLQAACKARSILWMNGNPLPSLEFAVIELGGEVGELQNEIKKLLRYRLDMAGGKNDPEAVADELGDVVICCAILADRLGLDLERVVSRKFNKTSDKHGFPIHL